MTPSPSCMGVSGVWGCRPHLRKVDCLPGCTRSAEPWTLEPSSVGCASNEFNTNSGACAATTAKAND
ncbi:rCG22242 [Rattus norvegicus]|uniref:RCG22242 n=1 Tax=Rattus norvegicus TaxID=10116 RepID=A6INB6_RAT|nr:rCG22242 [Rattus norvegicus]